VVTGAAIYFPRVPPTVLLSHWAVRADGHPVFTKNLLKFLVLTRAVVTPRTYWPSPTAIPSAAATQTDEVVVKPLTFPSANRMAPAPRKPTLVTILDATRDVALSVNLEERQEMLDP